MTAVVGGGVRGNGKGQIGCVRDRSAVLRVRSETVEDGDEVGVNSRTSWSHEGAPFGRCRMWRRLGRCGKGDEEFPAEKEQGQRSVVEIKGRCESSRES